MVEAGIRDDLPAIVEILNYTIMNSNATLTAQPTSAAQRLEWFERFSPAGPHRLLVARRGSQVLGYAASQPYRDHEGFREAVEVSIALGAPDLARAWWTGQTIAGAVCVVVVIGGS